jgi:putative MATE family efflux protein
MKVRSYEMDMTNGSLWSKILTYALPFIATGTLQLLFNTADVAVVGRFAGSTALAAVGSTSSLINLIVNLFMGLSVGVSVLVSQYYGAGQQKDVSQTVHTAITTSLICGIFIAVFGFFTARPLLKLMGSPNDVIHLATLYLRIYFAGAPFLLVYNFSAAVLRAIGDTRRPLYFLTLSGVVNLVLNLILVINFHLGVAGVAIATIVSELLSAVLILICLLRSDKCYRLDFSQLKIHLSKLKVMVKIGLPAGIQSTLFSISNVLIQSTINSFGSTVMAGASAAGSIEMFTYTAMNSISQTALAFSGQNIGAKKESNLPKILGISAIYVTLIGITLGGLTCIFSDGLLGIFTSDPVAIQTGQERMLYICIPYFVLGLSEVCVGMLRGMGYSFIPMIISVGGICALRVLWIAFLFPIFPTLSALYISYPISWIITLLIQAICLFIILHKFIKHSKKRVERT